MTQGSPEDAFLKAAAIAAKLPKHLQEIGFNRALDHLLGSTRGPHGSAGEKGSRVATEGTGDRTGGLIARIDRTKYSDIGATARVADNALKVLQLANDDLDTDGLTALEMSDVLAKKFRIPVTPNAVNIALERETGTVDVRVVDGIKRFHIMAAGDEYLKKLRSGETVSRIRRAGGRKKVHQPKLRQMATKSETTKAPKVGDRKAPGQATQSKRASGRPGPKAAVTDLITRGFFAGPRTIAAVQEELRHNRGHAFSIQELAPALVRSIRDGSLKRARDTQGQYEYTVS